MEENKITENNEIKENEVNEKVQIEKPKKSKKGIVYIVALILLICSIGVFAWLILEKDKNDIVKDDYDNTKYTDEVRIDASLATQPLTDAYIKGLTNFNIKADYTNTDPAYTKLINKETDLIIVTEPSDEELQRAKDANVELEVTPVVNEGFVFYTNVKNSVDSLKLDQIRKIYTGEITNWKQVGGKDTNIIAYQRPVNSGSQTGILSLVMNGEEMKTPTTEEYIETMAGIIDVVSNYKNGENSIGYSYYYYATTMYGNDNMKFFKVDGVEPNHDTIKSKEYPIITSYYIVTLKGNEDVATKKLKEAMLSSKGQEIAKDAGYVEIGK